jgi:hypothetical protein
MWKVENLDCGRRWNLENTENEKKLCKAYNYDLI